MPKMNVAFSLDAEELRRFDEWRAKHDPPLTRGAALVLLLEYWSDAQFPKSADRKDDLDAPY
jgi:hypothetical protein